MESNFIFFNEGTEQHRIRDFKIFEPNELNSDLFELNYLEFDTHGSELGNYGVDLGALEETLISLNYLLKGSGLVDYRGYKGLFAD